MKFTWIEYAIFEKKNIFGNKRVELNLRGI